MLLPLACTAVVLASTATFIWLYRKTGKAVNLAMAVLILIPYIAVAAQGVPLLPFADYAVAAGSMAIAAASPVVGLKLEALASKGQK